MSKIIIGFGIVAIILGLASIGIMIWPEQDAYFSENQPTLNMTTNVSATPYVHQVNDTFVLPSEEQIISPINWSKYHYIRYSGVKALEIAEPNTIINHTFIYLCIKADIPDPENVPEIYREMSSAVKAERAIVGPDSSIEIWGYVSDGRIFKAGILPFSSVIYRRDYVHPIHNLTFSDIDASEVD